MLTYSYFIAHRRLLEKHRRLKQYVTNRNTKKHENGDILQGKEMRHFYIIYLNSIGKNMLLFKNISSHQNQSDLGQIAFTMSLKVSKTACQSKISKFYTR